METKKKQVKSKSVYIAYENVKVAKGMQKVLIPIEGTVVAEVKTMDGKYIPANSAI